MLEEEWKFIVTICHEVPGAAAQCAMSFWYATSPRALCGVLTRR